MDPERLFQRLCDRHDLDPEEVAEYAPLVERAVVSPADVRSRILTLVEDSFARRAGGDDEATLDALEGDLDEEVLRAVAEKLHGWKPPWRRKAKGDDGDASGDASPGPFPFDV